MNKKTAETESLVKKIIEAIEKKKGKQIIDLQLGKLENAVCDHFIICHADSTTQVDAIAAGIGKDVNLELGTKPLHTEGTQNSQWVLLDYIDVVVHIFLKDYRTFYNLESLWADAPKKEYKYIE